MNPQEPIIDKDAIRKWMHTPNRDPEQHWLEAVTHITALLAYIEHQDVELKKSRALSGELAVTAWHLTPPVSEAVKYEIRVLANEYGSLYGHEYVILESTVNDPIQWLITNVIGEAIYYAQRDVWDQIVITNEAQSTPDVKPHLTVGVDPASPGGDQSVVVVAHTDNGTLIIDEAITDTEIVQLIQATERAFYEKTQSLDEMHCMFGSKPPTHHDLLAGDL